MNKEKINYLFRSAVNYWSPVICPHCGANKALAVDRKYIVTRLFKCSHCHLQFRHPVDSTDFNSSFYQEDYEQADGITTDLPSEQELEILLRSDFNNSSKNVDGFCEIFTSLLKRTDFSLVDYGCSWGYMSYQFNKRGIRTQSFEISKPRARYGNEKLGVDIKTNPKELKNGNDLFFSSHVIEHVPSVRDMVDLSRKLLTEDGIFMAECPNGSSALRSKNPSGFHHGWGLVHPNYLSDEFYQNLFRHNPYFITTTPYDTASIALWDKKSQVTEKTNGDQILVLAIPNINLKKG